MSLSESDGLLDVFGSRQTLLFRRFEAPRSAFDPRRLVLDLEVCIIFFFWVASTNVCNVNLLFSSLFHHDDLALGSGLAQGWYLMIGEPQQKWTAKNWKNWMMADRWSLPKHDGSEEQHFCPLRTEGNHMVWRCSCLKERGQSPGSH
jgi:hypothetical protein